MINRSHVKTILLSLFLVTLALSFYAFSLGRAANPIVVNSFIDRASNDGICTLREAIIAANKDKKSGGKPGECSAGNGADTITFLHPGVYTLTRTDSGNEDSSQTGDLDIDGDLTIQADFPGVILSAQSGFRDRIIHVLQGQVVISGVVIQNGNVSGDGGGIYVKPAGALLLE